MDISFAALSLAAHDAPARIPRLEQDIEDGVRAFFVNHIETLEKRFRGTHAPPSRIVDTEARGLFDALHEGDTDAFVAAADALTKRLIGRMDRRAAKGLLACVRAEERAGRITAVLKLDIDPSYGTRLEQLVSGEIRLAAVTNVLEQPGELQKGVLVTSEMAAEELFCTDRQMLDARYFPEAFGIQVFTPPSQGAAALVNAIAQRDPQLAARVARALPRIRARAAHEVIMELGECVEGMEPAVHEEIIGTLAHGGRPVIDIDTSKQLTATIEDGGVVIKVPAQQMDRRFRLEENPAGGWQVVVGFENEPSVKYR